MTPRGLSAAWWVPTLVVCAAWTVQGGELGPFLTWSVLALVVALALRQVAALRENVLLTRTFESRVQERTKELAGREEWFRTLVQNLNDVVTVLDPDLVVSYQTPSAAEHFGSPARSAVGAGLGDWWTPFDAARMSQLCLELAKKPGTTRVFSGEVLHSAGHLVPVEATVTALADDGRLVGFVVSARDVTERRQFERDLSHQAFHDALTGLANRALFRDRVEHALKTHARSAAPLAVLFLDLDGFKAVNDTLGHGTGDRLLEQVADLLVGSVRPGDTVARLGGDEFAILLEELDSPEEAAQVAARIQAALLTPMLVDGQAVLARASCGIALYSGDEDADVLLRNADLAMYRAKERGLGSYELFEPLMHEQLVERMSLESDLRVALRSGHLHLAYQPTLLLAGGSWDCCEALLRWDSPSRGEVAPADFIPMAEETGLIVEIGAWVLNEACRQTAQWRREHEAASRLGVAVNVSARQLQGTAFLEVLDRALSDSGLPASALTIELTESVLISHTSEALALLEQVKQRGVRLAIDDFGTGFSSLSYLHRFPVDILKVDRGLVSGLTSSLDKAELTRAIVQMGHSLGLVTVAEGIEEPGQLVALQEMRCDLGQGFLLSKPVRPDAIEALLRAGVDAVPHPV
jgi:diguanylate cyclase (GGDEF)-like protein/PAS domain S-box-containing protein